MNEETILLQQIDRLMTRVQTKTEELQAGINSKLDWLPGPLRAKVIDGWNSFTSIMSDLWANLLEIRDNMGSPFKLWTSASAWVNNVGAPVSAKSQMISAGSLHVDDHWSGSAADAYRGTLPLQAAALDKVRSSLCEGTSTVLLNMAGAIVGCWVVVSGALAALVAGLIGALLSTATIFGIPAAPFIAGAAGLVAVVAVCGAVLNLEAKASEGKVLLEQKLADNSAFGDGHWPAAVLA